MTETVHGTTPANTVHTFRTSVASAPAEAVSVSVAPWLSGPYLAGPKGAGLAGSKVMLVLSYPLDGRSMFIGQNLDGSTWKSMAIEARRADFASRIEAHIGKLFPISIAHAALDFFRAALAKADFDTDPAPWHQQDLP